ncbi:sarcosine oxidase subunit gamma [Pararhodobacter aggregans]|uniref:Sarcosine oxidase subunit gamma n=1 Tax=Pararhodobacter aggregans TaxID=404875 RepID=A0A2T7UVL5_9RHOB|nr:sarcosine oxidase subunit gamma [Pararhodobacter aggregans]PTX03897.1 sarcosine oxidase subunit gamma [Pararhodobacter aggregans]PVE48626.1 sarcosine oxidase subunit gamma [Pararhodobacter aggregans]
MADLIATPAVTGLPLAIGRVTLTAFDPGPVTAIAPYPGRDLSAVLRFPAPGEVIEEGARRLIWAGREMAFLTGGPAPDLTGLAAVTDQSDGWVWVTLAGRDATAVLARLCPLDLRASAFPLGTSAKSVLQHLSVLLVRTAEDAFQIAAYRSMAGTLVHDLSAAMQAVAARAAL